MDIGYVDLNLLPMPSPITWLRALLGHPVAQFSVAHFHWRNENRDRTIFWARRAAQRLPLASVFLANWLNQFYPNDSAVQREAAQHVLKAANDGCAEAQQTLASYYYFGEGVPRDVSEARRWCARAAQSGRTGCWDELLEELLYRGEAAPNLSEALRYAKIALDAGYPQFHNRVQEFMSSNRGV